MRKLLKHELFGPLANLASVLGMVLGLGYTATQLADARRSAALTASMSIDQSYTDAAAEFGTWLLGSRLPQILALQAEDPELDDITREELIASRRFVFGWNERLRVRDLLHGIERVCGWRAKGLLPEEERQMLEVRVLEDIGLVLVWFSYDAATGRLAIGLDGDTDAHLDWTPANPTEDYSGPFFHTARCFAEIQGRPLEERSLSSPEYVGRVGLR